MKKHVYLVDNYNDKYCIRDRKDNGLLFIGSLPDCYAWICLMEKGCF
jgi:hypothetical protein